MPVLLDSNVVSELIRKACDPALAKWPAALPLEGPFFSAVGEAELCYGTAILPAGRCRQSLSAEIQGMVRDAFGDRVLPFDRAAAREYADIAAARPQPFLASRSANDLGIPGLITAAAR